jgi:hypothetical protein
VADGSFTAGATRATAYTAANVNSGITSISVTGVNWWEAHIVEVSGEATSSPFDVKAPAVLNNGSNTTVVGYVAQTTGNLTDIVFAVSWDSTSNVLYTSGLQWTALPPCVSNTTTCGQPTDGDGSYVQYAVVQGQISPTATRASSTSVNTVWFAYKSATPGTASGIYPTMLVDFSGGTNGNAMSVATLNSSTLGGNGLTWTTYTSTGMSYDNTNQQKLITQVTVNGTVKNTSTATLSYMWNPSVAPTNTGESTYPLNTNGTAASACALFWWDATLPASNETNVVEISGGGDRITPLFGGTGSAGHDYVFSEIASNAASAHLSDSLTSNELYNLCVRFDGRPQATVTFSNGSAVITGTNTFAAGDAVQFTTSGTLPTNFAIPSNGTNNGRYFVIATGLSTSAFEVSATPGGTAISAGSAGSGTHKMNPAHVISLYDCGPVTAPTSCSSAGTPVIGVNASTGTALSPTVWSQGHASGGSPNVNFRMSKLRIDLFGGTPLQNNSSAFTATPSDTTLSTETLARLFSPSRAPSDTTVSGEVLSRGFTGSRVQADTAVSTETSVGIRGFIRFSSANVQPSTSPVRLLASLRGPVDTGLSGEVDTRSGTFGRLPTDTPFVNELPSRSGVFARLTSDLGLSNETTARVPVYLRGLSDLALSVEAPSIQSNRFRSASDSTPIANTIARLFAALRILPDGALSSETVNRSINGGSNNYTVNISDLAFGGELNGRIFAALRSTPDSTVIADALARTLNTGRVISNAAFISSFATRTVVLLRTAPDSFPVSNLLTRSSLNFRGLIDSTLIVPHVSRTGGSSGLVIDPMHYVLYPATLPIVVFK